MAHLNRIPAVGARDPNLIGAGSYSTDSFVIRSTSHKEDFFVQYQLKSPTIAVAGGGSDGCMLLVTVPAGAALELVGELQQSGLIDVRFNNRRVAMFLTDIAERGERILAKAV